MAETRLEKAFPSTDSSSSGIPTCAVLWCAIVVWSAFPQLSNLVFPHTPYCQLPEHVSKHINNGESVWYQNIRSFSCLDEVTESFPLLRNLSLQMAIWNQLFLHEWLWDLYRISLFQKYISFFLETQRCYFRSVISRWDGNVFSSGLKTWYFRSIEEGSTLTIPTSKQDFLLTRVLILPFCLNSSNWIEYE